MRKIVSAMLSILLAVNFCAVCAMADNDDAGAPDGDSVQLEQNENADIGNQDTDSDLPAEPEKPPAPEETTEESETEEIKPPSNTSPGVPYVTKDPLGETVKEGDDVVFIVKAEQVEYYVWQFISPDSQTVFAAGNVNERFKDVKIEGVGTDTIVIKNVPLRMDGWRVLCRLKGTRSNVNSQQARIRVISANPLSPKLSSMPSGGKCELGRSYVLSVNARELNENGVLNYQWYKIDRDSNSGGQAISGETSASLTVPQKLGTSYYYVEVWSTVSGEQSPKSVSTACAVTYEEAKEPLPTEAPAEEENFAWDDDEEASVNWLLIAFIAISLLAAAVAGFMVYTIIDDHKKEKQSTQTEAESGNGQSDSSAAPEANENGAEPAPENKAEEAVGIAEEQIEEVQSVRTSPPIQLKEEKTEAEPCSEPVHAEEKDAEAPAQETETPAADSEKEIEKSAKTVCKSQFEVTSPKVSIPEEPSAVQSNESAELKQYELEYRRRLEELSKLLNEKNK